MREKYYSQYLLRALDGEALRVDRELGSLIQVAGRMRGAVPAVPALAEGARRRIWDDAISRTTEPVAIKRQVAGVPRLAWGIAAGLAAAAAIVLVLVFVFTGGAPVPQPGEFARLRLWQGEMKVLGPDGAERLARDGEVLAAGDTLMAMADSRGSVEFEAGSIMRLEGEAEVVLSSGEEGIEMEVVRGKTYHRVLDGSPYVVGSGGIRATALGTAFDFEVEEGTRRIMDLQSTVEVEVDTESLPDWSAKLEEGDIFLYGEGDPEAKVSDLTREDLDNEWLRWNKSLDEELDLPVGALAILDEEPGEGQEPPPEQPEQPGTTPPDVEPPTPPAPPPTPPPPPPPERSVSLSAQASEGLVEFTWTITGYEGFQGYKLCRSESNPSPSYPGDWWKYVDGASARYTSDNSVEAGHTYYYRLGVYHEGVVLGYSNSVQVTIPEEPSQLTISLSGSVSGGKASLSWTVGGSGSYNGFKVCRSETNPNPSYPADTCTFVDFSQNSYLDASVQSGHTYYYRVGIYKEGTIVAYSNAIKLTLP